MTHTVLVVDDDAAMLATLREAFSLWTFEAHFAANAVDALRLGRDLPALDTLVSDFALGGKLDGLQLAMALQTRHAGLHCVLMSGHPRSDIPLPPGMRFLPKPFSPATLHAAILSQ